MPADRPQPGRNRIQLLRRQGLLVRGLRQAGRIGAAPARYRGDARHRSLHDVRAGMESRRDRPRDGEGGQRCNRED